MDTGRRIDKIFLLHIWACVPFAPLWLLGGSPEHHTEIIAGMRIITLGVALYLVFRTFIVFRGIGLAQWAMLWCVVDSLIVTGILLGLHDAEDPTCFIYFLVMAYAALRLRVRQVIFVVALTVAGQYLAGAVTHTWDKYLVQGDYMYVGFRHFFLILVASLIIFLRRESQSIARQLALVDYQRDIAAEMHDGIQHDLVLIARRLDLVDALVATDPARAASIAVEQRETARRASDELRFLIRQTRPGPGAETDFIESLRQHLGILSERFSLPIAFSSRGPIGPFPAQYQHPVLRIVQEAVTNAVKHSGAGALNVRIRRGPRYYHVRVSDDGRGFARPSGNGGESFGMASMASRAEALGGHLSVMTRPGIGTAVIARLPADPDKGKAWFHGLHSRAVDRG